VGFETARLLAAHFRNLPALAKATVEELQTIEGIGPVVSQSIVDWAARPQNQGIIRRLVAAGVNPVEVRRETGSGPLAGLTIVVTGKLERMSRPEAEELIRELGGKVGGSVGKSTTLLVVGTGTETGSKLGKAQQLGVRTIDEAQFVRLTEVGLAALEEDPASAAD